MEALRDQDANVSALRDVERRFVEFRAEGDTISGVVVRYGDVARFGQFSEEFRAGALTHDDVIVNLQHDRAKPVARSGAGLALDDDGERMAATITLPDTAYAREAKELVEARILRGFSMEFRAREEEWEGRRRVIRSADLVGFALVDRPAYPASEIARRFKMWKPHRPMRRYFV